MDYKDLEKLLKEQKNEGKKKKFSKHIVILVIFLMTIFTIANMCIFIKTGSEQSTLIVAVVGFLSVEVWSLASIKKTEVRKGENDNEYRDI